MGKVWHRDVLRRLTAVALLAATLGGCGGDDDTDTAATTTTTTSEDTSNTLEIEMVDYAYKVNGTVKSGLVTINSRNTGEEWHMAGFGKLKPGKTVDDITNALQQQGGGGEGGEEGGNPLGQFIEKELGAPGHVLQPGVRQSLTVDLEPGNYVMLCFLPTEGEGVPHFAKGMVSSFEVAQEKAEAEPPREDTAITLPDDAEPAGVPGTLSGGRHTVKVTASGSKGKDFAIGQLDPGQPSDPEVFDKYFEREFESEGGPSKGAAKRAPGTLLGMTFEVEPNQTVWMTVDLQPGETFFVSTTNTEDEGAETEDKFVKVTVT